MTLDLHGVSQELAAMTTALAAGQRERAARLADATSWWDELAEQWHDVTARCDDTAARITWLLATPEGTPNHQAAAPTAPPAFTVVGVDGSQIEMERHALTSFYLINTGWATLPYGTGERAELASASRLAYRPDELAVTLSSGRRIPVRDELLAAVRAEAELRRLAELLSALPDERPRLGLIDGNLIAWPLSSLEPELQDAFLIRRMEIAEEMRQQRLLFAGFISRSQGTEGVNLLRVLRCPDHPVRCDQCSSRRLTGREACAPLDGMVDAEVAGADLPVGGRSQLFKSRSRILNHYLPDQRVSFFYLNTGTEIARVEVPAWVAHDPAALDLVHAIVGDQCERGRGYPPALTEAHEQAVVSDGDRQLFSTLLARKLGQAGIAAATSAKQQSKRRRAV